ncbi:MAG TPA: 6-pyruvoyl-tetrahydropterin synthase-related protein [Aggregatilinea sp.]|uniref:6-pyruvoyl-tetrahydropterin synthase-related protein n=1 Tax=Aggregatilinea sp. TaxID=2806333 RepID=UPI002CCFE449|nr:6-pyruvoyl-tetrahydropterin synthase-related protein [Aggregatilinea sp.]HML20127.1 6-pyruvoyl-tetrahydropterin synthase-related protein [Aggregatilinea sp.]
MRRDMRDPLPDGLDETDLPLWMRKPRRQLDWPFVAVAILCMLVVGPLIVRPGLPPLFGYEQAASRAIEISASLESGTIYPRWAPDFNYGYGSPLWNFVAPLPHYLTGLYRVALQASAEDSVKAVASLSVFMAGLGMLLLVRHRWGSYAGLVAAAVYIFSPQLMANKLYREGDLAALLALGLLPVTLAAVDRALTVRQGRSFAGAAIAVAALWLSDGLLGALMVMLVMGWLAWLWFADDEPRTPGWGLAGGAVLLGTLAAAIFWLPALVERNTIVWHSASSSAEVAPTLPWNEILLPPERIDRSAVNPPATASIGWAVWALPAALWGNALVESWRRTPRDRRAVARGDAFQWRVSQWFRKSLSSGQRTALYFLIVGFLLLVFVLIPSPARDVVRSAEQDILLLVTACGALAAGQGTLAWHALPQRAAQLGRVAVLAVIALFALPVLAVPGWSYERAADDAQDVIRTEIRGNMIGSFRDGWLLPASVATLPHESGVLINTYEADLIDKVAHDLLPPGTQVDTIEHTPRQERLAVDAGLALRVTLLTFDYPGWRAQVDGRDVAIHTTSDGFISVEVPPGRHEVKVYFGSTPARRAGWLIALVSLGLATVLVFRVDRQPGSAAPEKMASRHDFRLSAANSFVAVLLFGGAYGLAAAVPALGSIHSPEGVALPAEHAQPLALQGGIDLLGYDLSPAEDAAPGGTVRIVLYWRAVRPDIPNYQVDLAIVGADDPSRQLAAAQHRHPGGVPVSRWAHWPLGEAYVRDEYVLAIGDDAQPGIYRVLVQVGTCGDTALMPCASIDPLFVQGSSNSVLGQYIALSTDLRVE